MLGDVSFIIACTAFALSAILMLVCKTVLDEDRIAMRKIWARLYYLEAALATHEIVPLPWEMEEIEDMDEMNEFKRDGNVVYLCREDD